MPNLLQQLENNEAVLLMYLAGELPEEDRVEVEQMLSIDANLRAELESIRQAQARINALIRDADATGRLPMRAEVASRRVGRAMQQWFIDQDQREPQTEETASTPRMPTLAYASAAAVLLLIGYVAWWGLRSDGPMLRNGQEYAPLVEGVPADDQLVYDLTHSFASADELLDPEGQRLAQMEMQLVALTSLPEQVDWSLTEQP
jgi:hypothetical protein